MGNPTPDNEGELITTVQVVDTWRDGMQGIGKTMLPSQQEACDAIMAEETTRHIANVQEILGHHVQVDCISCVSPKLPLPTMRNSTEWLARFLDDLPGAHSPALQLQALIMKADDQILGRLRPLVERGLITQLAYVHSPDPVFLIRNNNCIPQTLQGCKPKEITEEEIRQYKNEILEISRNRFRLIQSWAQSEGRHLPVHVYLSNATSVTPEEVALEMDQVRLSENSRFIVSDTKAEGTPETLKSLMEMVVDRAREVLGIHLHVKKHLGIKEVEKQIRAALVPILGKVHELFVEAGQEGLGGCPFSGVEPSANLDMMALFRVLRQMEKEGKIKLGFNLTGSESEWEKLNEAPRRCKERLEKLKSALATA